MQFTERGYSVREPLCYPFTVSSEIKADFHSGCNSISQSFNYSFAACYNSLLKSGVLPKAVYEEMRAGYQVRIAGAEKTLRELYNRRPEELEGKSGNRNKLDAIRRRLLLAEKGALNEAFRKRILSEEIVQRRVRTIDEQLLQLEDD